MGNDGFPDRVILLPPGKIFFVELKDKGRKPRPLQVYCHRKLEGLGFRVFVLDSKAAVDLWMDGLDAQGDGR